MKVGEKVSVTIQGIEVVQAEVKEVADGTATLIIPATRVVMATRTELAPEVTPSGEGGSETIVDEVVRTPGGATELPLTPAQNEGGVVGAEQTEQVLAQEKVISSSSVPKPTDPPTQLDPAVVAQIAAAVLAAQQATPPAEPAAEASGDSPQE